MGIFSRFERSVEDGLEGVANKMFDAPISPVQIAKKAERAMRREKMVGAGKQYAPTLYTVLVNVEDDERLFGYYPTLAGETETFIAARAAEEGLTMDGQPLVRFIADEGLRRGKFDIVAELVAAPIIAQLRQEEMQRYGLAGGVQRQGAAPNTAAPQTPAPQSAAQPAPQAEELGQDRGSDFGGQDQLDQGQSGQGLSDQKRPFAAVAPNPAFASDIPEPDSPDANAAAHNGSEAMEQDAPEVQPSSNDWRKQPLPYVPEEEIDRSIDYGEYTFNSQDFEDYEEHGPSAQPVAGKSTPVAQPWDEEDDFAYDSFEEDADLSGLDVEAYNPYAHDSRDFFENKDENRAESPSTAAFAGNAPRPNGNPGGRNLAGARLVNKTTNQLHDLVANRYVLGRSSSSDIVIDDVNASRSHAELRQESPGVWILSDLGSTNGTTVNGERIISCELELGDRIIIGTSELVFLQG